MATNFSTVGIRDFDLGVMTAFGGELVSYPVDGTTRQAYAVTVRDLTTDLAHLGGRVPIFWGAPDDPYQPFLLPSFVITRNSLEVAYSRAPWYGGERGPMPGASDVVLATGSGGTAATSRSGTRTPSISPTTSRALRGCGRTPHA